MSVGATRGLLGRVQKLERSRSVGADMLASVTTVFTDAIAQGRMCDTDSPVVMKCVLKWLSEGASRSGSAGWGMPN
ncbi:MAG TPA: hypothetical protein PKC22_07100 [Rhodocyclaceae bacterium]|nr:hypothetical protein [Rhodocyclaceae bacterium]